MKKGFTLIELLIVITIIAIIAAISLTSYQKVQQNGRDAKRQADLKQVQSTLEQYFADQFFYPFGVLPFGDALKNSTGHPNPPVTLKTYLNKLPCDPLTDNCDPNIDVVRYCYKPLFNNTEGCDNSTTNRCNNYKLYAKLENPPPASPTYTCGAVSTYNLEVTKP